MRIARMATFRRSRSGLFSVTMAATEADVLASLAREVLELLDVADAGSSPPAAAASSAPASLDPGELDLHAMGLAGLGEDAVVGVPDDEVLRRLLPDAYGADDPQAASEFRRFTERGLRERKAAAAAALLAGLEPVLGQGGRVQVDADGARHWLGALNDIRLALGTRLGVDDDSDALVLDADDPARWAWAVYDFTTHLQETLVRAMSR